MKAFANPQHMCCQNLAVFAITLVACTCMADAPVEDTDANTKKVAKASVVIGESLKNKKPLVPGKLNSPFGVAFDSRNHMYIVELEGGRIHRRDPAGTMTLIAGDGSKGYSGDTGPATEATFNGMHNVAATADGVLYIADSWNHCVRKIDITSGIITTIAGTGVAGFSGDGGPATAATFNFLMCVSLNPAQDKLYVADLKNRRVRMIDLDSNIVTTVAGNGEKGIPVNGSHATSSPLVDPRAVAVDSKNNVYILERGGHALRKVNATGKIETVAGTGKPGNALGKALESQFNSPKHLAIDQSDGVIIADDQNARVVRYDDQQRTVTSILGKGVKHPKRGLLRPHGICVHGDGSIYIVDTGHHRILRLQLN
jgi:DNA-binding beta-propeller fold protein YncE